MTTFLLASDDPRAGATLEYVSEILRTEGRELSILKIDDSRLPRKDRIGKKLTGEFKHSPEPLLRSWRMARNLQMSTKPGDVIVASDLNGLAGVFALAQLAAPVEQRRRIWTAAADSHYLELRLIARSHNDLPEPLEFEIDWEIVQYRHSDRVLATSVRAALEVERLGAPVELIGSASSDPPATLSEHSNAWVPGPVARRNQTGEILRAVTSIEGMSVTLSNRDAPDQIWTGTTWESTRHAREVLGARVVRGDRPTQRPSVVILGDPYSPPDRMTRAHYAEGVPIVVPTGSVASLLWPGAPQWSGADDLAALLKGGQPVSTPRFEPSPPRKEASPDRAARISVGIPVFSDTRFLDECVESILDQDLAPHEIVIVDDGSGSDRVDRALDRWSGEARISAMRTEHRGVCAARNRALETMRGDSFVFVDSDDILEPTFLAKCAAVLRNDASLWGVATWTRFFGAYEGIEAKPPFDSRVGSRENPIISTAVLMDMKVRDAGIRFEHDLAFLFCEDWHVWSQIVAAGGQLGLVPEPLANHRVHETSGGYLRTPLAHAVGKARATAPLRSV